MNMFYYISFKTYVTNNFGKEWLHSWTNRLYFWQGAIFVSSVATFLILHLLKWVNLVNF